MSISALKTITIGRYKLTARLKTGGCQDCWEKQSDEVGKMVKTIYQIKKSSRRSNAAIRKA